MSALTDQLANNAKCIDECIPDGQKMAVLISIFYQLLLAGAGNYSLSGSGSPLGVVTPTGIGQTYFDTSGTNNLWLSNGLGPFNWVQPNV